MVLQPVGSKQHCMKPFSKNYFKEGNTQDHPDFPDQADQTRMARLFGEKYNVVLRNIVKQ